MRTIERRWPENVESDWAIDCSSPMSANTSRNTGRREPASAGTDRKSGSAGMPGPRSPLLPYTPIFRSGVARERRERLGDRLIVADVGEHVAEHRQARASLGGH